LNYDVLKNAATQSKRKEVSGNKRAVFHVSFRNKYLNVAKKKQIVFWRGIPKYATLLMARSYFP